jgi:hypothetical protein
LLAFTCLTPIALGSLAHAETVISTKVTTPLRTATAANGAPDSIKIGTAGTVAPTGGTAVTIDSNHNVANEGAIEIRGANNAVGILADAGTTTNITNSGKITIDEDYTAADADKDGDLDGPFAQGSGRFGIRLAPGGNVTGNLTNSGAITVEGNNSAGIASDARLVGSLAHSGSVAVVGDNSVGIRAGDVTGNVSISGSVEARGANATGVLLGGDVGGRVTVQGGIAATGYRATTRPGDTSKLDADDLLQSGPALRIAGNVAGGVLFDVPPADTKADDKDEDKDGIEDAKEGSAAIASYGAAPAVLVGAADRAITIGALPGEANGHGFVNRGSILADGVYKDIAATALQLGGTGGGVTIAGGVKNQGSVKAVSFGADATAVRIGQGATTPELRNSGTVTAEGSSVAGTTSRAVSIQANGSLPAIRNSGTVEAKASGAGAATAIADASNSLTLIENGGTIRANGAAAPERNLALDARTSTANIVLRQVAGASGAAAPKIEGRLLFGAGADLLDLQAGSLIGDVDLGAGADQVSLGGSSTLTGEVNFGGGGGALNTTGNARYRGALSNAGDVAVNITGGGVELTNAGNVALGSLSVAQGGVLGVTVNGTTGQSTLVNVAGTAAFAQGSELTVRVTDLAKAEGRFTVLRAGTLTGSPALSVNNSTLPFMFKGALAAGTPANEIAVDIKRKTATELNLNGSETAIYDAAFAAMIADNDVGGVFLGRTSEAGFKNSLGQLMPDHAGGVFDAVTQGSRATARFLADPTAPFDDHGRWGWFLQQVAWGNSKSKGDTARFRTRGWGVSGGAELITDIGSFGVSLAFLDGDVKDGQRKNQVDIQQYELGGYWRGSFGKFRAFARASAAMLNIDSRRDFEGSANGKEVRRFATASRDGQLYSAALGASYALEFGRFTLRPAASLDWYRLTEKGYAEKQGGKGINLTVRRRTSDEVAANATATLGYDFGDRRDGWLRIELEGGRRELLSGELGDTVARFEGGNAFTLRAEERDSGWIGRARLVGGNPGFTLGGEASAEEQYGRATLAFRVSLQVGM